MSLLSDGYPIQPDWWLSSLQATQAIYQMRKRNESHFISALLLRLIFSLSLRPIARIEI
jgi:hypothetical protein